MFAESSSESELALPTAASSGSSNHTCFAPVQNRAPTLAFHMPLRTFAATAAFASPLSIGTGVGPVAPRSTSFFFVTIDNLSPGRRGTPGKITPPVEVSAPALHCFEPREEKTQHPARLSVRGGEVAHLSPLESLGQLPVGLKDLNDGCGQILREEFLGGLVPATPTKEQQPFCNCPVSVDPDREIFLGVAEFPSAYTFDVLDQREELRGALLPHLSSRQRVLELPRRLALKGLLCQYRFQHKQFPGLGDLGKLNKTQHISLPIQRCPTTGGLSY